MNIAQRLTNYIQLSIVELKKVIWPTKKEIIQHTLLVIGISLGVAAFLGIVDWILSLGMQNLI